MVKGMWYGLVENELPVIVSALGTELIYQPSGNYLQGIINWAWSAEQLDDQITHKFWPPLTHQRKWLDPRIDMGIAR